METKAPKSIFCSGVYGPLAMSTDNSRGDVFGEGAIGGSYIQQISKRRMASSIRMPYQENLLNHKPTATAIPAAQSYDLSWKEAFAHTGILHASDVAIGLKLQLHAFSRATHTRGLEYKCSRGKFRRGCDSVCLRIQTDAPDDCYNILEREISIFGTMLT